MWMMLINVSKNICCTSYVQRPGLSIQWGSGRWAKNRHMYRSWLSSTISPPPQAVPEPTSFFLNHCPYITTCSVDSTIFHLLIIFQMFKLVLEINNKRGHKNKHVERLRIMLWRKPVAWGQEWGVGGFGDQRWWLSPPAEGQAVWRQALLIQKLTAPGKTQLLELGKPPRGCCYCCC